MTMNLQMTMMQPTGLLMGMMVFLILAVGGVLVTFRVYAGREVRANHPASNDPQRPRDAVEDVALGHHEVPHLSAPQHP
ncbi:hypothetical protein BH11ACT8_BH11ACT8_33750 [soil metagenome]